MEDSAYIEDSPAPDAGGGGTSWLRSCASVATGLPKLAALYIGQDSLIFPGRARDPREPAQLPELAGVEFVSLQTSCKNRTAAMFGAALSPDGKPLDDASSRPTLLFFYGNEQHLANRNLLHVFDGFRRLGANVLVPEYVGYGVSTGSASEISCYATADAAYAHLLSRGDVDAGKIVAAGASLGGAVAIDLASRQKLAGLITLITFTSMPDMARLVAPDVPVWRFIRHKFESERKMPRVKCPALIIHSTGDALVPYTMSDRLARACGGAVTRVRIDGAGHSAVEMLEAGRSVIDDAMKQFLCGIP